MSKPPRGKSIHEVLRARREAKPLLTVKELRQREAARQRDEEEQEAQARLESWRENGKAVDAAGRLSPAVYKALFALDRNAYFRSKHWARRSKAQRTAVPRCEVARCAETTGLRAHPLHHRAVGEEKAGDDLMTLCEGCERRAHKGARERGRLLTRDEVRGLDPLQPLYEPAEIAALKARYARPLRKSDLKDR